jgi:hypothetical protein
MPETPAKRRAHRVADELAGLEAELRTPTPGAALKVGAEKSSAVVRIELPLVEPVEVAAL